MSSTPIPASPSTETTETTKTEVAAVEAPPVTVDPGQVIRVNARFPNEPTNVFFSFLAPQSDVAVHDPGIGKDESQIKREGDLCHYSIDTRGMRGGLGWWYFVSEDSDPTKRRAKVGRFIVRDVPRALLDRTEPPQLREEASGLALLGATTINAPGASVRRERRVLIGLGIVAGAAFALL